MNWTRRPSGTSSERAPLAYYDDEHGLAIFPAEGDWELCWTPDRDGGYELLGYWPTVAAAKAAAAYHVKREAEA